MAESRRIDKQMKLHLTSKHKNAITIAVITLAIVGTIADIFRRIYFGGGCLLKDIFDTPCASCGMSRAFLSLLLGDIKKAFAFHPLFWIFPITVGFGLLSAFDKNKKRKKLWLSLLALCILAYLVCWVIRLATGNTV